MKQKGIENRLQGVIKAYLNMEAIDLPFCSDPSIHGFILLLSFKLTQQHSTENESLKV